jgi:HD-GYP domain-containing protein (c-di-GMP phosphodiesterase class II)
VRYMRVQDLAPGMVLARTIWGASGEVLLSKGAVLTQATISALERREVRAVWIRDGLDDEQDPTDLVSDQLRAAAAKQLQDLFSAVSRGAPKAAVSSSVRRLSEIAESIVEEVLSAPVATELVALKTHDGYTLQHSVEVAAGCVLLGIQIGSSRTSLRELALGGLLHDVGKVRIPPEVLNKPGPLTPEEWDLMKQHPVWGYEIVGRMDLDEVTPKHIAWQHHERQDGKGYPRGLHGTNRVARHHSEFLGGDRIALCAEICAVADVYSAMRSDRPYRPGIPPEKAVRAIREAAGTQLNRELVDLFLRTVPSFPVGVTVKIYSGPFAGYFATVVRCHGQDPEKPVIRLVSDPSGRPCEPLELDLRRTPAEIRSWILPPVHAPQPPP